MKEFYTFKVKTVEACIAVDNIVADVDDISFEINSRGNEATGMAWLTPKQVDGLIKELYNYKGIRVTQNATQRNTIFVSFYTKC